MKINKLEDIIIPATPIGTNNGWDAEVIPIIQGYADYMGEELAPATSLAEIQACEQRLGTRLPEDLKLFYARFGPARLMEILLPVNEFVYLGASAGKSFLDRYNQEEQEIISKLVVFGEFLGDGNVWCFHKDTKEMFFFIHDTRPNINGMFDTFWEYLRALLIFSQGVMGEDAVPGLMAGAENIAVDLIGKDRVRVWQYFTGWD
jgi:hypothetical protein